VAFYRDINENGVLDLGVDLALGTDANPSDGWSLDVRISRWFSKGIYRYFAQAADANDIGGNVASATNIVTISKHPNCLAASTTRSFVGGAELLLQNTWVATTALDDDPWIPSNALASGSNVKVDVHAVRRTQATQPPRIGSAGPPLPSHAAQSKDRDALFADDLNWLSGRGGAFR
jgi:hypothetical protein